jgi:hypothetical protein
MKHCSIKEILKLKNRDLSDRKKTVLEAHISQCYRCSAIYKVLSVILSPTTDGKSSTGPSESVYLRVMSYYEKASFRPVVSASNWQLPFRVAAAAVVSIAVLSVALFYYEPFDSGTPIRASQVSGIVKNGKKTVIRGRKLSPGSRVETGNNSRVAFESGDLMKLNAGGHTSFLFKSARKEKSSGKTVFNVVMDKGTVSATFDKNKNLEYTFTTPHATITSRGSQIVLKVDNEKTMLLMKSGSAEVFSSSGTNITAEEGNGYTILSELSLNNSDDADILQDGQFPSSDADDLIQ